MTITIQGYGKVDVHKILKGFAIGLAGAVLTYTTSYITSLYKIYVPAIYLPVLLPFWSTIVNAILKSLDGKVE